MPPGAIDPAILQHLLRALDEPLQDTHGDIIGDVLAYIGEGQHRAPGQGAGNLAGILTGLNVPYSDEFRGLSTNTNLLETLAGLVPEGSDQGGQYIPAAEGMDEIEPLLAIDTFRHDLPKATSSQDAWYYMVLLGSCLFFLDVFVRRVQVGFEVARPLQRLLCQAREHRDSHAHGRVCAQGLRVGIGLGEKEVQGIDDVPLQQLGQASAFRLNRCRGVLQCGIDEQLGGQVRRCCFFAGGQHQQGFLVGGGRRHLL